MNAFACSSSYSIFYSTLTVFSYSTFQLIEKKQKGIFIQWIYAYIIPLKVRFVFTLYFV